MLDSTSMASSRERRLPPPAYRMENPFSVKVLQVFTGFGVGCGVGIGVGRPIYLGIAKLPKLSDSAVSWIVWVWGLGWTSIRSAMSRWVSHFVERLRVVIIARPWLVAISSNSSCRVSPHIVPLLELWIR